MKRFKVQSILFTMLVISMIFVSCSDSPEKTLEKAKNKTKEINYMKTNMDFNIGLAGIEVGVKVNGEIDNKNNKSIMNLTMNLPPMIAKDIPYKNRSIDMYIDKNVSYMKMPDEDKYIKVDAENQKTIMQNKNFENGMSNLFKTDEKVKETLKMEKDNNSNKIITTDIDAKNVKELFIKLFESKEFKDMIISNAKSQMKDIYRKDNEYKNMDEKEIEKQIEIEINKGLIQMRTLINSISIDNIKYKVKINKQGYISLEEITFDVKDPSSGLTVNMKFKLERDDINKEKKVKLPKIPSNKIKDISDMLEEYNENIPSDESLYDDYSTEDDLNNDFRKDYYKEREEYTPETI